MTDRRQRWVLPHQPLLFLPPKPARAHHAPGTTTPGWTTTDLWRAPVVTALYATLTHTQPFWADVNAMLGALAGGGYAAEAKLQPLDVETARALVLAGLFVTQATMFSVEPFSKGRCFRCCL